MQIKAGADALERGDFVEIGEADLESYLQGLTAAPGKRARRSDGTLPPLAATAQADSCAVAECSANNRTKHVRRLLAVV